MGKRVIGFAGTFVLEPVAEAMIWWMGRLGFASETRLASYGQILEPLIEPTSPLRGDTDLGILLVRPEDLLSDQKDAGSTDVARADAHVAEMLAALAEAAMAGHAQWLVSVPPPSPGALAGGFGPWVKDATHTISCAVAGMPTVHFVGLDDLASFYEVSVIQDEFGDETASLPYSEEYMVALGTRLARTACAAWSPPRKAIILDCDNTLWEGVCGEPGDHSTMVPEPFQELQRFMLQQRELGRLLCVCSHNSEAGVLSVFNTHPGMLLSPEDIAAWQVNWEPKHVSVSAIAEELNLSIDTFIFVDDDPLQRALMLDHHPEVAVVDFPSDPVQIPQALKHAWVFDQVVVTEDDRHRAERYRADAARRRALSEAGVGYEDFLRRSEMRIDIRVLEGAAAVERAIELTERTSQFNLTGGRLNGPVWHEDGRPTWIVNVQDRYGDYGTVGLMSAVVDGQALQVLVFLLSCRILNRRVEYAMLRFLGAETRLRGLGEVRLAFHPTSRNEPARRFVESLAGRTLEGSRMEMRLDIAAIEEMTGRLTLPRFYGPREPADGKIGP